MVQQITKFYQMSSIWVPYIIFRNTDNDDAVDIQSTRTVVSVKKQGNFIRSGLDIADEVVTNRYFNYSLKTFLAAKPSSTLMHFCISEPEQTLCQAQAQVNK